MCLVQIHWKQVILAMIMHEKRIFRLSTRPCGFGNRLKILLCLAPHPQNNIESKIFVQKSQTNLFVQMYFFKFETSSVTYVLKTIIKVINGSILSDNRSPSDGASISHTIPWGQPFPEEIYK